MTVICWDGKTLAADRQMGSDFPRAVTKLRRSPVGELLGIAGWMHRGIVLMDWWIAGCRPEKFPEFQRDKDKYCDLIVIGRSGAVMVVSDEPTPLLIDEPFHAIGSGRDFAAAAMYLGHDARRAVEVASALCGHCGRGIDTLTLEA